LWIQLQKLMRIPFSFLFCLLISKACLSHSQKVYLEVQEPIDRLFKGMSLGDSAMVSGAFTKQVSMATITKDKNGAPLIRFESSINDFLKAVGTPHLENWNEPIWDLKISIDGDFAQAWANYAFYVGKKFSHCGVDAFHLFKAADGKWRIFYLTDTRQKQGCDVPKRVSDQFK
jgi:hypothetical protein